MDSLDGIITLIIFLLLFGRFVLPKLAYLAGKIVQRIMLSTGHLIRCPECGAVCKAKDGYCGRCGRELGKGGVAEQKQQEEHGQ